jgi:chaperonin GroES
MSQIVPLNDRIVVTRLEVEDVTKGGLFIPETGKEKPQSGMVIAVGSGKIINNVFVALDVKIGDTVLFGKYSGTEVTVDDAELLILREDEIFAKLVS